VTPTRGSLGAMSARSFLALLGAAEASGTLFFGRAETSTLILLRRGKAAAHTDLGGGFDIDGTGAQFGFWPHAEAHPLPSLPSRYPASRGTLWALPALSESLLFSTAETDLRGLAARLARDAFTGALALENTAVQGLLLFYKGQLGGATSEEGARGRGGSAALRSLLHLAEPAALSLHALPELVTASLLGWLLGLRVEDAGTDADTGGMREGFTGLELTPTGARYYRAGTPYLQVPNPGGTYTPGRFAPCRDAPNLALPTEPSGWEGQRYGLTLRGRDALNPMTELSMRFRGEYGRIGQQALEGFRGDLSLEEAAQTLGLDLKELKSTAERLESEGFIRPVRDPSPTPPLYTR